MNEEKKMVDLKKNDEVLDENSLDNKESKLDENQEESEAQNTPGLTVDSSISSMTEEELMEYINSNKIEEPEESDDPFKNMTEEQLLAYINGDLDLSLIGENEIEVQKLNVDEATVETQEELESIELVEELEDVETKTEETAEAQEELEPVELVEEIEDAEAKTEETTEAQEELEPVELVEEIEVPETKTEETVETQEEPESIELVEEIEVPETKTEETVEAQEEPNIDGPIVENIKEFDGENSKNIISEVKSIKDELENQTLDVKMKEINNQDYTYDNSSYDLVTQNNPTKPFSQMTEEELIDFINRNSNTFLDYYDNNQFANMSEEELINYINAGNCGYEYIPYYTKKEDVSSKVIKDEEIEIKESEQIIVENPQDPSLNCINEEKRSVSEQSNLPNVEVKEKVSKGMFDICDYKAEYDLFKSDFIRNKVKKNKNKPNYKLQEGIDYEINRNELIRIENNVFDDIKYNYTPFDKWLFENYKSYKYVGEAKRIKSEYKLLSKSKYTPDDLYKLKIKFEEAFIPSIFYTSKNGIYAKKNNDYLIAEYNGDLVPYRYLKSNDIYYPLYNLVYADAINQINIINHKKNESEKVRELYFNDYCYFDAKENVSGSEKLTKAYKKMAIISFVIGLILIIIGVLALIPFISQYIEKVIDLDKLPTTLFISGGVMCVSLLLYPIFMIPLKMRNKRLKKVRRCFLVFMQNENNIYNVKKSIALAKVKSFNKAKLNSKVRQLAHNDYDVIRAITAKQIKSAKLAREKFKNTSRSVRWVCRVYSVLTTALLAGSVGVVVNLLLAKFSVIKDDNLNFIVTYLAALGVSVILGCGFLFTKKKSILNRGLYYLYNIVIIIIVIVLQMFVLYTF